MSNTAATYANAPFDLGQVPDEFAEFSRRIAMDSGTASPGGRLGIEMVRRILEQRGNATSFSWFQQCPNIPIEESSTGALATQRAKNEAAIRLLKEWMADESGYDEKTWPVVKQAIEESHLSARRRFIE